MWIVFLKEGVLSGRKIILELRTCLNIFSNICQIFNFLLLVGLTISIKGSHEFKISISNWRSARREEVS
jgi:hypothetical protein